MVMGGNQAYCGEHFPIYTNAESLCGIPETSTMLQVNDISIKKKKNSSCIKLK